jgi:hypothetical protein
LARPYNRAPLSLKLLVVLVITVGVVVEQALVVKLLSLP